MGICAECNKAKVKAWAEANRERMLEQKREYGRQNRAVLVERGRLRRQQNPEAREAHNARGRAWYAENTERGRAIKRAWEQRNKDAIREAKREARQRNPEPSREKQRRWKAANPEKVRMGNFMRRHRHLDPLALDYLRIINEEPCSYCGAPCQHIDHIVPLANGGDNSWDNLTPACATCNKRKHSRSVLTFMLDLAARDAA